MQRKTFHLVAVGLLALGVVISVVGGVGERFTAPAKRTEAPKPAPPAAPKASGDPAAPAWTFAPRRPIDESAVTAAPAAAAPDASSASAPAMGTPPGSAPPFGSPQPGTPPAGWAVGSGPFAPGAYDSRGQPIAPGAPGSGFTRAGPTAECPRGTLVRAGSSGPEVFCAP